ncbi:MAG: NBR1-Ig-like domain-containing protein, partial [Chloroflexota bacterium]
KTHNPKSLLFVLLIAVIALAACSPPAKPTVKFTPISGQINAGQEIAFQVTASDSGKGIVRVEFLVDNAAAGDAKIDPPQKSIALPFKWMAVAGQHTVSARAYNADSATSDLDTMVVVASGAPAPAPTVAPTGAPTAAPTVVVPTPGPGPCANNAAFIADVTVPDGTQFQPNQQFNKIWRVQNVGSCTWNPKYQLASVSGERMTNLTQVAVPSNIAPGQTADLLIAMTAPAAGGVHAGQWQLRDENGAHFGPVLVAKINTIVPVPPPQAAVTSPGANFSFAAGAEVIVTFQGVGNTELSSVALFINNTQVSKATSRAATRTITGTYKWQPGVGSYTLYAIATDIQGQATTSGKITGMITQPQPQCQLSVNFRADAYTITVGQSTVLRWDVECANAVYLNGQGVTGHEARSVAPNVTTAYTLRSIKKDGSPDERHITITVNAPPPNPTATPVPQRRNVSGTWKSGDYSVELTEALGCSSAECGIAGRMIHQVGTTTPQITDVSGSFHVYTGAVSWAAHIPGGQSFSGSVNASSNQ